MNLNDLLGVVHHFPTQGNAVYIRQMTAKAGWLIGSHVHKYDHYSILASGSVAVEVDGTLSHFSAPHVVEIKAGQEHKITCITDVSWFCIHGTEETDESNIDAVLIDRG